MKIKYCPVCKDPLKEDHDADDEAESDNYHDYVGHNYSCKKHGSMVVMLSNDRPYR